MVLFLFVVMLLNASQETTEEDLERRGAPGSPAATPGLKVFGALLALALVVELVWALTRASVGGDFGEGSVSSVAAIGRTLFTDYAFPFEVTSVLILVAMVGAVVLARRGTPGDA
jgi:NADH-quinone oxidoreductase subunit J